MENISAFVAHGFQKGENDVWNSFATHLRAIKTTTKWFDFEDGEPSEGKPIGDKVKARIDAHPIFIALFTRRYLVSGNQTSEAFWPRLISTFSNLCSPPVYSTSSWVIQESGYAIAKQKHLIFLVENGVLDFPKLQDNLEVIFFQRNQIDTAATKLMQMLMGFQAKSVNQDGVPAMSESGAGNEKTKENIDKLATIKTPQDELMNKIIETVLIKKDIVGGRIIIEAQPNNDDRVELEAMHYYFAFLVGDQSAIQSLIDLASSNANLPFPQRRLGEIYEQLKDYVHAAEAFSLAAKLTEDPIIRINRICDAALSYARAKKNQDAVSMLTTALSQTDVVNIQCKIFETLGNVAKIGNKMHLATVYWEKALEMNPFSVDTRFSLAYQYGELGLNYLAIFHYTTYTIQNEKPMAYNNLGVVYSAVKLPGKANTCYRQAAGKHETLAMANLANSYMNAGFLDDARKLIQDAQKENEIHDNIGKSLAHLAELENDEKVRKDVIEEQTIQQRDFQIGYCNALMAAGKGVSFAGSWEFRHGTIPLIVSGNSVSGQVEIKLTSWASLTQSANIANESSRTLILSGEVSNSVVCYTIKSTLAGKHGTLLTMAGTQQEFTGYAFINSSGIMEILEIDNDGSVVLSKATRKLQ